MRPLVNAAACLVLFGLTVMQARPAPAPTFLVLPPAVPNPRLASGPSETSGSTSDLPMIRAGPPANAVVVEAVDGDTIRVRIEGRTQIVRLLGIDTPELHRPGTPVECFARTARDQLAAWLPQGAAVTLLADVETRDRYGRLLAYVLRRPDGLFVNAALARQGLADELSISPNLEFSDTINAEVMRAQNKRMGLWGSCEGPHVPA